ncbi:TetR/AcrR family transcriptional regulator [Antrihabitans sp. YC2-6]|uniref:TetR/AcrR family transcriptional regulator n=1 Tax=Antrihabitans sp. YC2-6 TaxID=2799498 RepID=UPI0018F39CFB|nr:TetR/AcrR family transcriptional regulator [Antrihabitans sp. YC2-6]MBJ8345655.1 TetR/AcrR family transcriptional regulator [Antrihabitans sp. YC2-6]
MTSEKRADSERPQPRAVSPGRPPKSAVAALQRQILRVAGAEFLSRGYAEANMSRIASDAGVSKKTIYARYPSKDELLVAVTSDLATRSYQRVIAAMSASDGDPEHVLTSFGTQVAEAWASPEEVGVYRLIVSEAPRFPQLASIYRDTMDLFRVTLAEYLKEQCAAGTLEIADTDVASRQFGMLVYGEIREKGLLGEPVTNDELASAVKRAVKLFLTGYATMRR